MSLLREEKKTGQGDRWGEGVKIDGRSEFEKKKAVEEDKKKSKTERKTTNLFSKLFSYNKQVIDTRENIWHSRILIVCTGRSTLPKITSFISDRPSIGSQTRTWFTSLHWASGCWMEFGRNRHPERRRMPLTTKLAFRYVQSNTLIPNQTYGYLVSSYYLTDFLLSFYEGFKSVILSSRSYFYLDIYWQMSDQVSQRFHVTNIEKKIAQTAKCLFIFAVLKWSWEIKKRARQSHALRWKSSYDLQMLTQVTRVS